jgi:hypothetical protein
MLDHLEKLNPAQRRAMEHGVGGTSGPAAPLLVIAGAGSGTTITLAHRVAHLIVNGVDPRRILLMTFSRRAATENGAPGRTDLPAGAGPERRADERGAHLGGHFPRHPRQTTTRVCRPDRPRPRLYDPRPGRLGRPDEPHPPRARLLQDGKPVSHQRHLPRRLLPGGERRNAARRRAVRPFPLVCRLDHATPRPVSGLRGGQAGTEHPMFRDGILAHPTVAAGLNILFTNVAAA